MQAEILKSPCLEHSLVFCNQLSNDEIRSRWTRAQVSGKCAFNIRCSFTIICAGESSMNS